MGVSESHQVLLAQEKLLLSIEAQIGYRFVSWELLKQCLTYDKLRAANQVVPACQKYESLGSTVLKLVITEYLYNTFPQIGERALNRKRIDLIKAENQREIGNKLNLHQYFLMGIIDKGQKPLDIQLMGYEKFVESLLGGIYIDAGGSQHGLYAARKCVHSLWILQDTQKSLSVAPGYIGDAVFVAGGIGFALGYLIAMIHFFTRR